MANTRAGALGLFTKSGLALLMLVTAAQARSDDPQASQTQPAPVVSHLEPIDPATGRPFASLEDMASRTAPQIRVLMPAEEQMRAFLRSQASRLGDEGQLGAALSVAHRLLELEEATLGADHPGMGETLATLGLLSRKLGRVEDATTFDRRALLILTDALGERHPDTVERMKVLASDYRALGLIEEAFALDSKALSLGIAILGEKHPATLTLRNNLARDLDGLGRTSEAEAMDRRALELRTDVFGEAHPATLVSLGNLALDLGKLGRASEAEPLSRRVLDLRRQILGPGHPETLISLANLAGDLRALGRTPEAELLDREAYQGLIEALGETHPVTLSVSSNLSADLSAQGRFAEAVELDHKILDARKQQLGPRHPETLTSLNNLAFDLIMTGQISEAEALHEIALETIADVRGQKHPETVIAASNLAFDRLLQPERAVLALAPARLAYEGSKARFAALANDRLRGSMQQGRDRISLQATQRLFADALWSAGGQHDASLRAEAFAALQEASARSAARAIGEVAARRYATGSGAAELVAQRKALGELWAATERQLNAALGSGGSTDTLRGELLALENRIAALDVQIAAKAPQYSAIVNQPALSLQEAQAMLREDEAVLMVVPGEFGTHVMALTREGLQWHRADIDAKAVGEAVSHLRAQLDPSGLSRATMLGTAQPRKDAGYDRTAAWELYAALVRPVEASLAGKGHLFVAADGALASLPFGVLVTRQPEADRDDADPAVLRGTPWLSDAFALVQIPSLQSLAWLRAYNQRPKRQAAMTFAGFGDPLLGGTAATRGSRGVSLPVTDATRLTGIGVSDAGAPLMDPAALRKLARLPGTRRELEAMRQTLGAAQSSLRMEAAMTEAAIRSADLSRTRILHMATHGLTAGESGARAEPGLVFTPPAKASNEDDGYLAASEVLALDLTSTDWVILSACNTAASSGNPGETGLSGLARAFFYAGAPSLLASHWPVDDAVAAQLTVDVVRRAQQSGTSKAQALQASMQAIRNDPAHPEWAHPAAWAPFALVGEGR